MRSSNGNCDLLDLWGDIHNRTPTYKVYYSGFFIAAECPEAQ